jgi:hypothetical protein
MAHMQSHLAALGGTEHRRQLVPEQQLQAAYMATTAMEDARIRMDFGVDLATRIQHGEGFTVLENERREFVMLHATSAR